MNTLATEVREILRLLVPWFYKLCARVRRPGLLRLVERAGAEHDVRRVDLSLFTDAINERGSAPHPQAFRWLYRLENGFWCGEDQPTAFAGRWNESAGLRKAISIDGVMEHYRGMYQRELRRMRRDMKCQGLEGMLPGEWYLGARAEIDQWDGGEPLRISEHGLFVSYCQDRRDGRSLPSELRETRDAIAAQSTKASFLRRKLESLERDPGQAVAIVFELRVLRPLIMPPNVLVELEPKLPGSTRRAEALVRLGAIEVYIEATIFTKIEAHRIDGSVFAFGHDDIVSDAQRVEVKLLEKGDQLSGTTRPTLLFVAIGPGFLPGAVREGIANALADPGTVSISAVVEVGDVSCTHLSIQSNAQATHALPQASWTGSRTGPKMGGVRGGECGMTSLADAQPVHGLNYRVLWHCLILWPSAA